MIMRKKAVPLLIGKEVSPPRVGVSVFPPCSEEGDL